MQMLAERKFPTDNICLKVCLDVARWYGVQNTSQMRYQAETKRLWTIGYTLFCEKCVRYMSGYKNAGQIQGSSTRGERLPSQSHINFAVPRGGGGGGTLPQDMGGVCSCGSETPTRPLIRANFWWKVDPYLGTQIIT